MKKTTTGKKNSFVMYNDYAGHFDLLSAEETQSLMKAIFQYNKTGDLPDLPPMASMAFSFIKSNMDRDHGKYQAMCKKNQDNVNKRWNKDTSVSSGIRSNTNAYETIPTDTKHTDTDTGIDIENGIVTESDTEDKDKKKKTKRFIPPSVSEVVEYARGLEMLKYIDPNIFVDHFQSNGWKVGGKTKMKDWKAAARNWARRNKNDGKTCKIKSRYISEEEYNNRTKQAEDRKRQEQRNLDNFVIPGMPIPDKRLK